MNYKSALERAKVAFHAYSEVHYLAKGGEPFFWFLKKCLLLHVLRAYANRYIRLNSSFVFLPQGQKHKNCRDVKPRPSSFTSHDKHSYACE